MPPACSSLCILNYILMYATQVQGEDSPRLDKVDPMKRIVTAPDDVFKFTTEPSNVPSMIPSIQPSLQPTLLPSLQPSLQPTVLPSLQPSSQPTLLPSSLPSLLPTSSPSIFPTYTPSIQPSLYPSIEPTSGPSAQATLPNTGSPSEFYPIDVPDLGNGTYAYFNYDPFDTNFGPGTPIQRSYVHNETVTNGNFTLTYTRTINYTSYDQNAWALMNDSLEGKYWDTFETDRTLRNKCDSSPTRQQSPIDLCGNYVNAECFEHHQIRNRVSFEYLVRITLHLQEIIVTPILSFLFNLVRVETTISGIQRFR